MHDVLDYLNDALTALRNVPEMSRQDANAVQKMIAALDVTLRLKASKERATKQREIVLASVEEFCA